MIALQEKFKTYFNQNIKPNLNNIDREGYLNAFVEKGFPTTKLEEWKYTSLRDWFKQDYKLDSEVKSVDPKIEKIVNDSTLGGSKLVFINGIFQSEISVIQDELDFTVFKDDVDLPQNFGKILKEEESLVNLNNAISNCGYIIKVGKSDRDLKPVEVFHFYRSDQPIFLNLRNYIEILKSQELSVIETHNSLDNNQHFINQVTEVDLKENAKLDAYKIQNDNGDTGLVDFVFCNQQTNSVGSINTFSFGGKTIRNGFNFKQLGENCNAIMQAITLGDNQQHIDHHTLIEHTAPNCESHELYKTILKGESTGVFNGKIIVDAIAQKIDAFQQNNNILLSPKAKIDSKPQLEIFADDVKCSHGCTVGQLDKEALFYMESRGIPVKEAQAYLLYAFCADVLEGIKHESLKDHIAAVIADKLEVSMNFE